MHMLPDLLAATNDYWQKLDALEAAYQQGEISLQEVDASVAHLMAELAQERRAALSAFWNGLRQRWLAQKELILGVSLVGVLAYAWVSLNQLA